MAQCYLVRSFLVVLVLMSLWPRAGSTSEETQKDHSAVLELGAAGERELPGGSTHFGPTLGLEVTPIEGWLELEWSVEALTTGPHTELSGEWLFKKPFRLAPRAELMIGAGPSISRILGGPEVGTHYGLEVALDFMFWPSSWPRLLGRDTGWYLEPSWGRTAGSGERSVGLSAGLLIGWP